MAALPPVVFLFDLNGNVLWRYYHMAEDIRFSSDGKLIFIGNGGVFDAQGTMLYDILPGGGRSIKVGWINSNATRYISAIQDTRTTEDEQEEGKGTPGFELILLICVIALVILLKRKRYD